MIIIDIKIATITIPEAWRAKLSSPITRLCLSSSPPSLSSLSLSPRSRPHKDGVKVNSRWSSLLSPISTSSSPKSPASPKPLQGWVEVNPTTPGSSRKSWEGRCWQRHQVLSWWWKLWWWKKMMNIMIMRIMMIMAMTLKFWMAGRSFSVRRRAEKGGGRQRNLGGGETERGGVRHFPLSLISACFNLFWV